jgi:hypothetical protein
MAAAPLSDHVLRCSARRADSTLTPRPDKYNTGISSGEHSALRKPRPVTRDGGTRARRQDRTSASHGAPGGPEPMTHRSVRRSIEAMADADTPERSGPPMRGLRRTVCVAEFGGPPLRRVQLRRCRNMIGRLQAATPPARPRRPERRGATGDERLRQRRSARATKSKVASPAYLGRVSGGSGQRCVTARRPACAGRAAP